MFEQLGATVVYDNGTINATGRGHTVSLKIGSQNAIVDGQQQTVDVAPFIIGASTYVPLRFVSQALGASVNYDGNNNIVAINTGGGGNGGAAAARSITPRRRPPPPTAPRSRVVDEVPARAIDDRRGRPTVEASFAGGAVDPNAVRITLDGRDVTDQSDGSPRGFTYTPRVAAPAGRASRARVGQDRNGQPFARALGVHAGTSAAAVGAIATCARATVQRSRTSSLSSGRPRPARSDGPSRRRGRAADLRSPRRWVVRPRRQQQRK